MVDAGPGSGETPGGIPDPARSTAETVLKETMMSAANLNPNDRAIHDRATVRAERPAMALRSEQVFPQESPPVPVAVAGGGLSVGVPSCDAVLAEHAPQEPGGGSCRACGFVYTDQQVCPALILAAAGYPFLADRVRVAGNTRSLSDGESTGREMHDAQDRLAESFSDHPELALRAPVIGDAFGRILARCWTAGCVPGEAFEVVERDDGLVTVSDAARYFGGPETWPSTERWACESAVGRVLDVGCGAGRHALALAARGHDVIGLEPSAGAVEVARGRGVCTVPGSIDNPPVGLERFDTLLLAGSNLGLLGSRQAARSVLGALAAMASPGAQLLGCGIDPCQTSDSDHLAYHAWNRDRDRYPGQVRLRVRDGRFATEFFNYLFLSADELTGLVEDSPWQLTAYDTDGANCLARLILR